MNTYILFIFIPEQSFDTFSYGGSELCWRIGGACFSSGGDEEEGEAAAAAASGRQQTPETTESGRLQRLPGNVVHKQANSIIRPAPRVGTQLKRLSVWKV